MTITYTGRVANARLCAFSCLLFHWKGSIYKLMYKEMAIFCSLYAIISTVYRVALDADQKRTFEKIALYCETFINLIPLSFVLGFYIAIVVTRWWNQYISIPWPDRVMVYVSTMIEGNDEQGRLIRRTLMRYLALGSLIVFQATSVRVKKRFPTFDHLIEAGIASRAEIQALDEVSTPHGKWWIPFVWCCNLIKQARKQGRIADNYLLKSLIDEISAYRGNLGMLYSYDWISIPLVYTQVTTLAVYTFFLGCVFGRQYLDPLQNYPGHNIDLYIPFFTLLQFFFYMGWLKVAEQLINPFGEDDDDFEMNWIIDRNMQVSLLTTDDLYGQTPPIEKDLYFGEPPPDYLPYTKSSIKGISQPHMGSTVDIRVSDEGMKVLSPLETIQEGVVLGNASYMSSYLNTPRRTTPLASPHLGGHCYNQNFMSGMLSSAEIRSQASLHSCDKDTDEGSVTTSTSHSIIGRATEKLGKWLTDHSSRTDLNRSLHSAFVGIVSRQTSTNDDVEHGNNNGDALIIGNKEGQIIACTVGGPPAQNVSKLSPVPEVCTSSQLAPSGDVLIELNSCDGSSGLKKVEATSDTLQNDTDKRYDQDSCLVSVSEQSIFTDVEQNSGLHSEPTGLTLSQNEDFGFSLANSADMKESISIPVYQEPKEANAEACSNNEKPAIRSRLTVTQVTQGNWVQNQQSTTIHPGWQEMNQLPTLPRLQTIDGRLPNGDLPQVQVDGKAFHNLQWMPHDIAIECQGSTNLSSHLRDSYCSDSSVEYDLPESNQCTVTSMTPLLTSAASKNYIHEFNASSVDKPVSQANATSAL